MISTSIQEVLLSYRMQEGLSAAQVAQAAGISELRYTMLESSRGWPGSRALSTVLDALNIPKDQRSCFAFPGTPLSDGERALLHAKPYPALVVDHTWRVVDCNRFFADQLPECTAPGASLLRWVLLQEEARHRLANWEDAAAAYTTALRDALTADPDAPELQSLRAGLPSGLWETACPDAGQPDGQCLVWRTAQGPYVIWECVLMVPASRPDLLTVDFIPQTLPRRSTPEPTAALQQPASTGDEALLAGIARCGACNLNLTTNVDHYQCPDNCVTIGMELLESRVAEAIIDRVFTAESLRKLALAQEILLAEGGEIHQPFPVSPRHARHQWDHDLPVEIRRAYVTHSVERVLVTAETDGEPSTTISWKK
ncbi:MmyB family transcriptional regulator [Streptomyces halobius]|uniref:Helix-turn-helix domain-containing protein n=1 Tax=Streptomyces halobius TaxID=2879846 RepID=A0ABY4MDW7_9ACTN|nr:helix-turn-helix domain-containing protein [Streptomyces halobius]UQA95658.1 helix-turn-helix domain-containing protein [Streptomyces halobius]